MFLVNIESKLAESRKVSLPQGSILGLFLFLFIYVNDMPHATSSQLYFFMQMIHHITVDEIKKQLKKDLENIYDWFVDNKLSINFSKDKNKLILFASKKTLKNVCQLNIININI